MLGLAILKSNPTIPKRTTPDTHLSYFSCCDNKIPKESNCISYFPVAVTKHRDPKRQRKQSIYFGLQFQRDKLHCGRWQGGVSAGRHGGGNRNHKQEADINWKSCGASHSQSSPQVTCLLQQGGTSSQPLLPEDHGFMTFFIQNTTATLGGFTLVHSSHVQYTRGGSHGNRSLRHLVTL